MARILPVVLSGGSGTRLWPLSRSTFPKQFIRGFNGRAKSLLGDTLERLPSIGSVKGPLIIANQAHRFLVRDELERAALTPSAIILEPSARNTGPAIAVAALAAAATDPECVLVVMPSDHVIDDVVGFREAVNSAALLAQAGHIVLFGITPISPHTGYGYIQRGVPLERSGAHSVLRFTEKPDSATAGSYLASGDYFWNSGIFVFRADAMIAELQDLAPTVLEAARRALGRAKPDLEFLRLDGAAFATAPSVSIDYAVLERTSRAVMLQLDIGWDDLGAWSSLSRVAPQDAAGNSQTGHTFIHDCENCYVHSERALVAAVGVKDLVIVETPDAVLVADKSRAQDVAKVVSELRGTNRREADQHVRTYRPWGYFETLNIGPRFQVKLLHVKPGGLLSVQMHHHRSEHWVVVQGTAKVTIDQREQIVGENESVYISAAHWHRLENPGIDPLELIEVQIGAYLGEDDIIRGGDVYARAPDETA